MSVCLCEEGEYVVEFEFGEECWDECEGGWEIGCEVGLFGFCFEFVGYWLDVVEW